MSKHAPGKIPKGTKWGVCGSCEYRITDDDMGDIVMKEPMEFHHGRCVE